MTNDRESIDPTLLSHIKAHVADGEKGKPWVYLDSKGKITTGYGFKFEDDEADKFAELDLTYKDRRTGETRPATTREKKAWFAVMKLKRRELEGNFNIPANHYKDWLPLEMSVPAMKARLETELRTRIPKLKDELRAKARALGRSEAEADRAWEQLNDDQKATLADIAYAKKIVFPVRS